jgi:SAM-dependent methyltransferase
MKEELQKVPSKCVLCGDSRSRPVVMGADRMGQIPGSFTVVSCVSCGTWRIDPAPPPERVQDLYPEDYEAHTRDSLPGTAMVPRLTHRLRRRFAEWTAKGRPSAWTVPISEMPPLLGARLFSRTSYGRFNPLAFHGEGRRLLDVGCATGDMLSQFQVHGWMPVGIEPSERAATAAKARGFNVVRGRFPDDSELVRPWAPFSAVIMSNVIEHLSDPLAAVREAFNLLEPGGFILVWTPVIDGLLQKWMPEHWYNLDIPRHLYLFNRKGLESLLRQVGFNILATWPGTSTRAVLRTFSHKFRAGGKTGLAERLEKGGLILKLANPIVRLMDMFDCGDIMIIMAQRPESERPEGRT